MLQRSPTLTEQVKSHLKQRIASATFEGGRIPSETDLASELKVSRTTIRDALSRLEAEGVIHRRQGAGTFVNENALLVKARLDSIILYETMIREQGYTPSVHLLKVGEHPADETVAAQLKLQPGEPLVVTEKLFQANAAPVIFIRTCLPARRLTRPPEREDFRLPIFELLPRFCGQPMSYFLCELVPLLAPPWLTAHLELPAGLTAVLSLEEIAHNQDNLPLARTCSYFRDDLLRLRLIRRLA